jgi:hypothetical protein
MLTKEIQSSSFMDYDFFSIVFAGAVGGAASGKEAGETERCARPASRLLPVWVLLIASWKQELRHEQEENLGFELQRSSVVSHVVPGKSYLYAPLSRCTRRESCPWKLTVVEVFKLTSSS